MNRPRLGARAPKARTWPYVAFAALLAVACGARLELMTLPAGPGTPAPDAAQALAEASASCRRVSTFTAAVGIAGSIGGHRVPRVHLLVGLVKPSSVRIEATAPLGGAVFVFVAKRGDATLVLSRDDRVLEHGDPRAVLEALTGVPLGPASLADALTGCAESADATRARHLGDEWIVMPDADGSVYLSIDRASRAWQIVAATHADGTAEGWRAEYHDFRGGLPQTIRLSASDRRRFDLSLALSQVDVNTPIEDAAFTVKVPASAVPITLDELGDARAFE